MTTHISNLKIRSIVFVFILTAITACTSEPPVKEFVNTADPQVELDRVDQNINQAQSEQVDILSPKNFEASKEFWNKAVKARSNNKDQKEILHNIAVSQAYLDKANKVSNVAHQVLNGPIVARKDAISSKSQSFFLKEMQVADNDFKKLTKQIEGNDTSHLEAQASKLEAKYREIELKSIKKDKLGVAQDQIEQAIREGAKTLTPETLAWAQKQLAQDESIITAQKHNTIEINKASANAIASAERLMKMVRNAKNSTARNPEDSAKLVEKNEMAAASSENQINQVQSDLEMSNTQLGRAKSTNEMLESQAWLDKEYEKAQAQFTKDEAEVYKQGNKLLLRLKGLAFTNNKASLNADNYPLLAKVQNIIDDIGQSQITIEGHTDSTGSKKLNDELSKQRANSVLSYLVANKNIAADRITAAGLGDTKPIATNKTAQGRAQNRRVDIVISTDRITE